MGLNPSAQTSLLSLLFANASWTGIGNAGGLLKSTVDGSFYVRLHTAEPTTDDATLHEATYTGYVGGVAVARSAAGWTVATNSNSNAAPIAFPQCTAVPNTITHFSICLAATGVSQVIAHGALTSPSSVAVGIGDTPSFTIGALTITD